MKRNSGWKSIRESAECRRVSARVADLRKERERIYPSETDVFRAFDDCPFEKVRVTGPPVSSDINAPTGKALEIEAIKLLMRSSSQTQLR
jgi:hypothetical protein